MSGLSSSKGLKLRRSISIFVLLMILSGCITVRFSNEVNHTKWLEVNLLPGATDVAPIISTTTAIIPTHSQIIHIPQPALKLDTWYFIAITRQARTITMYLDGRAVSFGDFDPLNLDAPISLKFGRTEGDAGMYLNGRMDEVEIYNGTALTAGQIIELYSAGSSGKCVNSIDPQCVPPPAGLTGWWPGDGNGDELVSQKKGFFRDNATTGPGLVGEAFQFNGDHQYFEVPDDPALNFGTRDFTIDLWVNFTDLSRSQTLVEKWIPAKSQEHPVSQGWTLSIIDNRITMTMEDGNRQEGIGILFQPSSTATAAITHLASPTVFSTKTPTSAQAVGTPAHAYVCTDPIGCLKLKPNDPIHFAYILDLVGASSSLGVDSLNALEIAIDDSEGQILGHKIQLTGMDSGCNGDTALSVAKNLVSDTSIVAVIGPSCSSEVRTAGSILSDAGLVIISPSTTRIDLTDPNSQSNIPGFFRTAPKDKDEAVIAADFVYNFLNVRSAATIDDGGLYASTMQQIFSNQLTKLGGTITFHTSITAGSTNMRETLNTIALGSPDLIYMPIFMPSAAYIIEQAKTITGLENTRLMGSELLYSPDLSSAIGSAVDGFLVTCPAVQGPAYDAFLIKYEAKFEKAPINIFHAHAYDAFNLLKAAIEKVAIQEADGTLYIPRQALRNAVASTKDFPGVTGNLTCNLNGDCANTVVGVYEYHSNEFPPQLIWQQP